MPRSSGSWTLVAALAAALAACGRPAAGSSPGAAGRPNVLLITIDTLRADHLGFHGYAKPTSPNLDALAAQSVVFDAAQASSSWTLPSLASALTGEPVSTHGCWNFTSVLDDSFTTLTELLVAAGYDTACVTSHLFVTTRHGLQQGFVHTDDSFAYPEVEPEEAVTSHVIADKGIRFLTQKAAAPEPSPWFLWLHFFDPHERYMEHAELSAAFVTPGERAPAVAASDLYDGEIRYTDLHVGRVLDALEEAGFAADTIVVFTADHGEEFGEHGGARHGHTLFEELVRVPFTIRVPGLAARRVPALVRGYDLMPTVLELVGLQVPAAIAGRSLVPALRGEPAPALPALAELALGEPRTIDCVREGRFKLVSQRTSGERALYDLVADPGETRDVQAEHPAEAERLAALLAELVRDAASRGRASAELVLTPGQADDLSALGYGTAPGTSR